MKITESFIENNSIQLQKSASSWEEALKILFTPLVQSKAIKEEYIDAIITRTNEIGPFYVIGPKLAMPHERGELGALKDAFTILTLNKEVEFPTGEMVDILIGFSATNSEVHIAEAIPQIVMLFEDEKSIELFRNFKTKEELITHINKVLD